MKSLVILFTGLFSLWFFDLSGFRTRRIGVNEPQSIERELSDYKETHKRRRRRYRNQKFKRKPTFRQKTFKYRNSTPKDVRFSDQQKLRRMYRNG